MSDFASSFVYQANELLQSYRQQLEDAISNGEVLPFGEKMGIDEKGFLRVEGETIHVLTCWIDGVFGSTGLVPLFIPSALGEEIERQLGDIDEVFKPGKGVQTIQSSYRLAFAAIPNTS